MTSPANDNSTMKPLWVVLRMARDPVIHRAQRKASHV